MRIILDARTASWSGVGRYVSGLIKELALDKSNDLTLLKMSGDRIEAGGARLVDAKAPVLSLSGMLELKRFARHAADVFHSPMYVTPAACPTPIAVTIHDLIPLRIPEVMPSMPAQTVYRYLNRRAVRRSALVFAPSEATKRDIVELLGCPREKVMVVPHAIDDLFLEGARKLSEGAGGSSETFPYILSGGNHKPSKNLVRLIEAFALVEQGDIKLVLIGDPDTRFPEVAGAISQFGLQERVVFTGKVDDYKLIDLYASAFAFVFPSLYEGFGLPPLEAMACGTPVACSNTTSLPEVVGDAAVLFDPLSLASISESIVRLLGDEELRGDLVAKGKDRAKQFTWKRTAELVREGYVKIVL